MKKTYLENIYQKAKFDEIYKVQIKLIEDKEKEHKQRKIEEAA
jgi:hypothetical protein